MTEVIGLPKAAVTVAVTWWLTAVHCEVVGVIATELIVGIADVPEYSSAPASGAVPVPAYPAEP